MAFPVARPVGSDEPRSDSSRMAIPLATGRDSLGALSRGSVLFRRPGDAPFERDPFGARGPALPARRLMARDRSRSSGPRSRSSEDAGRRPVPRLGRIRGRAIAPPSSRKMRSRTGSRGPISRSCPGLGRFRSRSSRESSAALSFRPRPSTRISCVATRATPTSWRMTFRRFGRCNRPFRRWCAADRPDPARPAAARRSVRE